MNKAEMISLVAMKASIIKQQTRTDGKGDLVAFDVGVNSLYLSEYKDDIMISVICGEKYVYLEKVQSTEQINKAFIYVLGLADEVLS